MSYSFSAKGSIEELSDKLGEAYNGVSFNAENESASREQASAAIEAALAVTKSGFVGQDVSVSISGHANPDHKPTSGWANDAVTISVISQDQATETPADAEPANATDAPPADAGDGTERGGYG